MGIGFRAGGGLAMSGPGAAYFVVDRIEGKTVVLVDDGDLQYDVPRRDLPGTLREGSVLRVEVDEAGAPRWETAELDEGEERRRMDEARKALDRLKKRDPGGDVVIP